MSKVRKEAQITPRVFLIKEENNIFDCIKGIKENRQIIINISSIETRLRYRIVDFLSGYIYALNGNRVKLEDNIYMFSI